MKVLFDINILLACAWENHPFHEACDAWFDSIDTFTLCPITELGFMRISMSPAYKATFEDAREILKFYTAQPHAVQVPCDCFVETMSLVTSYKDTTDSYLVRLAANYGHRLATLDNRLVNKKWAEGIAFNPLIPEA